jgi:uncharacterized protein YozE (UPF0346 family)
MDDSKMTFKEYIMKKRVTDTPAGDFTKDARSDSYLPDAKTWEELKSYIQSKTRNQNVIGAARIVWRGYKQRNRNP